MSGYALIYRMDGGDVPIHALAPMAATLAVRGPDGTRQEASSALGIASALLDTGDPRQRLLVVRAGDQVVAGQVRLDGREELAARLREVGMCVRAGDADLALFAHAWKAWGTRALDHLIGDFSVAIVNHATHACTLVRDPFGVRMLFYSATPDRIVASNTLEAVRAAPGVTNALNEDAIADFLAVGLNENLATTTFRDILRVPPGSFIEFAPGERAEVTRYWRIPESTALVEAQDYADRFRNVLEASVRDRCREGSVAIAMSGGLDSTSLAAIARHVLPASANVTALTIDLPTIAPSPDAERARSVARHCGLSHVEFNGDGFGFHEGLEAGLFHTPEPYSDPDLELWRAFLASARDASRVMLYGEDPDTLLAPPDLHEQLRMQPAWKVGWDILSHIAAQRARPHLGVRDSLRRVHATGRGPASDEVGPAWLRADLRERRRERLVERVPAAHRTRGELARRLAYPLWQSALESLDAGQHGIPIDIRLPFLDVRVVECAVSAPAIPWLQRKHLLREAVRGLVPDSVRLAAKQGLAGLYQGRVKQWWRREPRAFVPSATLASLIDSAALPVITPGTPEVQVFEHLRLRILDRWLRTTSAF